MTSWIISGARTPIGKFLGGLSHVPAPILGGAAIRAAVDRAFADSSYAAASEISEVIMGQVLLAGAGQAPARQAALSAGLADSIGCATVNKVCGSGLYAVMLADRSIRCGDNQIVVAGGMESMSRAPHLLRGARAGWKYGSQPLLDSIEVDGLICPHSDSLMGSYAEKTAIDFGVSREMQDQWACESHRRAVTAGESGAFSREIVPIPGFKGATEVSRDESPRADCTLARLSTLKPVFDTAGCVTAGNASSLSDGAAAVVVVSESLAQQIQVEQAFRIVSTAVFAARPNELFIAPAHAIRKLLHQSRHELENVDLFELNEAFASQTLACQQSLDIDPNRLNVRGGAIALGHPIGCSGARILVTLMHALTDLDKTLGVASLCLGGGEAVAMLIERCRP